LTAANTAELTALTHKTVNQIFLKIRERLSEDCSRASPFAGEVEVDESYFGAKRVHGRRGRGAGGKQIVFGIYKRHGKVFTELVPNCQKKTLQAIIRGAFPYFRTTPQQADGAFARKLVVQSTYYHEFFKNKELRPFRAAKETHSASRRGILFV
jgi:hypothetical protein